MKYVIAFTHLAQSGLATGARAASGPWASCLQNGDVATLACIPVVFTYVVRAALVFGGTIAVAMIIYGGFRMILSGGEAKQAGAARQTITFAIIGLIIVLLSFGILNFIAYITGVQCITFFSVILDNNTCK